MRSASSRPWIAVPVLGAVSVAVLGWMVGGEGEADGTVDRSSTRGPTLSSRGLDRQPAAARQSPGLQRSALVTARSKPVDEAEELVARHGAEEAADQVLHAHRGSRPEQLATMESVIRRWSERDASAAWSWISGNLKPSVDPAPSPDHELWQAAVGGFVEGVAVRDPELAADAAEYLEPGMGWASEEEDHAAPGSPGTAGDPQQREFAGDPGRPGERGFLARER